MAAVSVLSPGGYPRPPYGSFTGKPPSASKPHVSVLGPGGYPKALYASFAGKPTAGTGKTQPLCSVLGPGGYPRPPYGAFGTKAPAPTVSGFFTRFFVANVGRLMIIEGEGPPAASTPANAYVAEDGVTFYVAEDGVIFYMQE